MSSSSKVFTLEEVAKHSSKEDCWLVIGGKVGPSSPPLLPPPPILEIRRVRLLFPLGISAGALSVTRDVGCLLIREVPLTGPWFLPW